MSFLWYLVVIILVAYVVICIISGVLCAVAQENKSDKLYFKLKTNKDCDELIEFCSSSLSDNIVVIGVDYGLKDIDKQRVLKYVDLISQDDLKQL